MGSARRCACEPSGGRGVGDVSGDGLALVLYDLARRRRSRDPSAASAMRRRRPSLTHPDIMTALRRLSILR